MNGSLTESSVKLVTVLSFRTVDNAMQGSGMYHNGVTRLAGLLALMVLVSACSPRVEVAVPDKPITINLNVKIEHEIRVKVEKELEDVFSKESGLF